MLEKTRKRNGVTAVCRRIDRAVTIEAENISLSLNSATGDASQHAHTLLLLSGRCCEQARC